MGYNKGSHFWEVPTWISMISGNLKECEQRLHIVENIDETIEYIKNNKFDVILFSVLDVNKYFIKRIIQSCPEDNFVVGGYIDFCFFDNIKNLEIYNCLEDFYRKFKVENIKNVSYDLFKDLKIIPRLKMSEGCLHRCKFCTITNELIELSESEIINQINSFKPLNFKLIYVDDKTFGQAKNYEYLREVYNRVKRYNSGFEGFIIQTTFAKMKDKNFISKIENLNIKVIELGLETFNDDILKKYRKPTNEKTIREVIHFMNEKYPDIKIIINLITGMPEETKETYNKTFNFVYDNIDKFFSVNLYNLAVYENTELGKEIKSKEFDNNELDLDKSFLSIEQKNDALDFSNSIFNLFTNKLLLL